jgi:hypothetical protein
MGQRLQLPDLTPALAKKGLRMKRGWLLEFTVGCGIILLSR